MKNKQAQLLELISALDKSTSEFIDSSYRIMKAGNSKMFSLDLLACAVNNRAFSLAKGFVTLVKKDNYLAAIPLIRLQLDNGLRFFAATLVENSNDFFDHYISGKAIKDYKDINGKNLSDYYLTKQLEKHFKGVRKLYNDTSGYIHLSDTHLFATTSTMKSNIKERKIQIRIGNFDIFSIESKIDFLKTMIEISEIVLIIIEHWKFEKERLSLIIDNKANCQQRT